MEVVQTNPLALGSLAEWVFLRDRALAGGAPGPVLPCIQLLGVSPLEIALPRPPASPTTESRMFSLPRILFIGEGEVPALG